MFRFRNWLVICLLSLPLLVIAKDNSLFYQLESPNGVVSYLFGTMHTDDNRVTDFSPIVIDAIKQRDAFMMEVAETQDIGMFLSADAQLQKRLNETEFDQLKALAEFHVMHMDAVVNMKPWLLAFIFSSPKPQTPFAQDNLLKTKSEELLKEVVGIESAAEHFGAMDQFSMDDQMMMLKTALNRQHEAKEKDFERLLNAYLAGDADNIIRIDSEMTGSILPKALWERMRKVLLDDRNQLMAARTIKAAKEKPVFIAVGAAHLGGKTGLIKAYQQAGFKLTPITENSFNYVAE